MKERFWDSAEWIFGADSDLAPVNFEKDIAADYLSKVSPRASVILHARRNREVTASFVGFKSHDKFANCFFEYWNFLGQWSGVNSDNGDLLQAVLEIVFPHLIVGGRCQDNRLLNYYAYMECFGEMFNSFVESEEKMTNSNSTAANVGIGPFGVPIKIYMPLEGFWRQYEGPYHNSRQENIELNLLETDTFVHGYKKIGELFGKNDSIYHCRDVPLRLGSSEMWWSEQKLLQFAKDCCLIKYHMCTVNDSSISDASITKFKSGNTINLKNICASSERCQSTQQGRSGIGFIDGNCSYSKSNLP
jgi:hypothetical protein